VIGITTLKAVAGFGASAPTSAKLAELHCLRIAICATFALLATIENARAAAGCAGAFADRAGLLRGFCGGCFLPFNILSQGVRPFTGRNPACIDYID